MGEINEGRVRCDVRSGSEGLPHALYMAVVAATCWELLWNEFEKNKDRGGGTTLGVTPSQPQDI